MLEVRYDLWLTCRAHHVGLTFNTPPQVGCAHDAAGLNEQETRSHFGAWCIVSSPLTLSMDVNNDTIMDAAWPVVANSEAIAINQVCVL
jgi:hypothetical protein